MTVFIILLALGSCVVFPLYCALVVASREDDQPQNNPPAKKQAKQPKQANACNGANAGNISDCGGGQGVEKQLKQAKQPDNDTVNDTDIKEVSTSVLTKKRTDSRSIE